MHCLPLGILQKDQTKTKNENKNTLHKYILTTPLYFRLHYLFIALTIYPLKELFFQNQFKTSFEAIQVS